MKGSEHIHIGASGWHYDHWRRPFYAQDLDHKDIYGYLDNDPAGHAPLDALRLRDMVEG